MRSETSHRTCIRIRLLDFHYQFMWNNSFSMELLSCLLMSGIPESPSGLDNQFISCLHRRKLETLRDILNIQWKQGEMVFSRSTFFIRRTSKKYFSTFKIVFGSKTFLFDTNLKTLFLLQEPSFGIFTTLMIIDEYKVKPKNKYEIVI